jgi:hypothetical protein
MEKLLTAEEVAQVDRRLIPSPTQERNWKFYGRCVSDPGKQRGRAVPADRRSRTALRG